MDEGRIARHSGIFALYELDIASASAETIEPPKSTDSSANISLFAAEPAIVTPIGATVDSHGRLQVIESNTHFRPANYQGRPPIAFAFLKT